MLEVSRLNILEDNYTFLIHGTEGAILIDPGEAKPILAFLQEKHLRPLAILVTHHHPDHIGGIQEIKKQHDIPVYGSKYDQKRIPLCEHPLIENQTLDFLNTSFQVLDVKGHTLGHIAYYNKEYNWLFSGDTIFGYGCGKLFEGTAEDLFESFQKIKALPKDTQIYFSHEYTESNIDFSYAYSKDAKWLEMKKNLRVPSCPTTLAHELEHNLFLKTENIKLLASVRRAKDQYNATATYL